MKLKFHVGVMNSLNVANSLLLSENNILSFSTDHHQNMWSEQWFEQKLIPNFPSDAVVVMDNADYLSRQTQVKYLNQMFAKMFITLLLNNMGVTNPPIAI